MGLPVRMKLEENVKYVRSLVSILIKTVEVWIERVLIVFSSFFFLWEFASANNNVLKYKTLRLVWDESF